MGAQVWIFIAQAKSRGSGRRILSFPLVVRCGHHADLAFVCFFCLFADTCSRRVHLVALLARLRARLLADLSDRVARPWSRRLRSSFGLLREVPEAGADVGRRLQGGVRHSM